MAEILGPTATSERTGGGVSDSASTGVSNSSPIFGLDSNSISVRFGLNVSANAGFLGSASQDVGAGEYAMSFSVRSSGNYDITFVTSINGQLSTVTDELGCSAEITPLVIENPTVTIDAQAVFLDGLRFPELHDLSLESGGDTRFAQSINPFGKSTVLSRRGVPDSETYNYIVAIGAKVVSNSCKAAFRFGAANAGTTGCDNCDYPGVPARTLSEDGYFLDVFVEDLCGNGTRELDEQCDLGTNNGLDTSCCTTDCTFRQGGTCRATVAGVCDRADVCSGATGDCPDTKRPAGFVCQPAVGVCDAAEVCDGTSNVCVGDFKQPSTVVCRAAAGDCDEEERCDGGNDCPADLKAPATTVCRAAADDCDRAEACDGSTNLCPEDALQPFGTGCTDDGNVCTNDTCDALGACIHPFNTAPCSDGNFCTDPDVCAAGTCVTSPRECPAGSSCDETADACLNDTPPTPTAIVTSTPTAIVTPTPTVTPSPTSPVTAACVGDCNSNRLVAINELILSVNIALEIQNISACPAADPNGNGTVAINELIAAVNNALNGCP